MSLLHLLFSTCSVRCYSTPDCFHLEGGRGRGPLGSHRRGICLGAGVGNCVPGGDRIAAGQERRMKNPEQKTTWIPFDQWHRQEVPQANFVLNGESFSSKIRDKTRVPNLITCVQLLLEVLARERGEKRKLKASTIGRKM